MAEYNPPGDIESVTRHVFKDGEYCLSMSVGDDEVLNVQVEDEASGDKWSGRFDEAYIEELTHKTGNFKQFSIFCSMLESGLQKISESIMLDLMTYSDLESLRSQKTGNRKGSQNNSSQLNSKRYLIMTYTVEFDRIHYPLSLQYVGKSDVKSLRQIIKQQRDEISDFKTQMNSKLKQSFVEDPQREEEFENLLREKEEVSAELEMCKGVMKKNGVAKELRILKKVIQSLESDLLKERSKYKRMLFKKSEDSKRLAEELEEMKASERNLRVRCKNLTEELAMMKRPSSKSPQLKLPMYSKRWAKKETGRRSASRERLSNAASPVDRRHKTPSPSDSRRFNPTAFIEERKRRQREAEESRGRNRSNSQSRSGRRSRSGSFGRLTPSTSGVGAHKPPSVQRFSSGKEVHRPRASSVGSYGSRHSSLDSGSDRGQSKEKRGSVANRTKSTGSIPRRGSRKSVVRSVYSSGGSDVQDEFEVRKSARRQKRRNRNTNQSEGGGDDDKLEGSLDIAQIDARLNALQKFMKTNLNDM